MNYAPMLVYVLVACITPGPNNIMAMYLSAHYGFKGARKFMIGSSTGFTIKMLLCGGLNLVLAEAIPAAVPYVKWIGAAYMLYLALGLFPLNKIKTTKALGALHIRGVHIVDEVVVKVVNSAFFQLLIKNTLLVALLKGVAQRQLIRQQKALAGMALYQGLANGDLAFKIVIHIGGVKVCKTALQKGIHHFAKLLMVDGCGVIAF